MSKYAGCLLAFALLFVTAGCGGGGGTVGDANDPETSSDTEQMQDETGDAAEDASEDASEDTE